MKNKFDPVANYESTKEKIGYVSRSEATQDDYDRIGFMSGLEVHQQLLTSRKLFCRCPAGIYHKHDDFDAEVIRHMRPTLSELGEYDGTALMEFRTKKNIIYRINNETACTYEVDDTPPFPIDREALDQAIEISLLSKLNIVGEVHIARKQYLDGSIPTGFQRTAIIGVEGEIALKNKKVRLIQLSIEEDSCREISDIGHWRIYKTDRLGMPLIETVTYPDFVNPDEVREGCDYIRFLNRSTGKVRVGMGAGRQDVNVSCRGGSRVEIKGVAHTKWIPELTHVEAFRQWALLEIRDKLNAKIVDTKNWKINHIELKKKDLNKGNKFFKDIFKKHEKVIAVNLPSFYKILSHFTQPGKTFSDELSGRLKVIACLDLPNMVSSEALNPLISRKEMLSVFKKLNANIDDAFIIFWGPEDDVITALETIEERCQMAFDGVPNETRKSFVDGSTIFERVLPGADRMYPDTDSAPIPVPLEKIDEIAKNLPTDIIERYKKLKEWGVSEETFSYLFSKNLFPLIDKISKKLKIDQKFIGNFLGHKFKFIQGHYQSADHFDINQIFKLFKFLKNNDLHINLAEEMLREIYSHPKMDFDSVLHTINFKKRSEDDILAQIPFFRDKFNEIARNNTRKNMTDWIMGELHRSAVGNMSLKKLAKHINK